MRNLVISYNLNTVEATVCVAFQTDNAGEFKIFLFVISMKFNGRDHLKSELQMIYNLIHLRGIRLHSGVALVMCWKHTGVCR